MHCVHREPSNHAGIGYKKYCSDCTAVHIRETGQLPTQRTQEHRKDVEKSKPASYVYTNVQSTKRTFDFNNVNV